MATVLHMAIGTVQTAIKSLMAAGRLLKAAFRAGKHNLYILVETVAQAAPRGQSWRTKKKTAVLEHGGKKIEMLLASIASLISNSKNTTGDQCLSRGLTRFSEKGMSKICGTVIRLIPLTVQKKDISPSPN